MAQEHFESQVLRLEPLILQKVFRASQMPVELQASNFDFHKVLRTVSSSTSKEAEEALAMVHSLSEKIEKVTVIRKFFLDLAQLFI